MCQQICRCLGSLLSTVSYMALSHVQGERWFPRSVAAAQTCVKCSSSVGRAQAVWGVQLSNNPPKQANLSMYGQKRHQCMRAGCCKCMSGCCCNMLPRMRLEFLHVPLRSCGSNHAQAASNLIILQTKRHLPATAARATHRYLSANYLMLVQTTARPCSNSHVLVPQDFIHVQVLDFAACIQNPSSKAHSTTLAVFNGESRVEKRWLQTRSKQFSNMMGKVLHRRGPLQVAITTSARLPQHHLTWPVASWG